MTEPALSPELARQRAETDMLIGLTGLHGAGGYAISNASVRGYLSGIARWLEIHGEAAQAVLDEPEPPRPAPGVSVPAVGSRTTARR